MIGDGIMSDLIRMRLYWRNQCWKEHSVLYDVTVTVLKEWIPMQEDSEQLGGCTIGITFLVKV